MKIKAVHERTEPIRSEIRNAYFDFSQMTASVVALVTDVVREGRPVIGYGFNSNGRYAQGCLLRERFIPRLMQAEPSSLVDPERDNLEVGEDRRRSEMGEFYVAVGDQVTFAKTIGESDVYLFAGITGDLAPNHVNEEFMAKSAYGRRIAHGVLLVGFMSTASTLMIDQCAGTAGDETPVSLGYDRIRFLAPAFIGDTVTVTYRIAEIDPARRRSRSDIQVRNQARELVAVAQHILKWVENPRN